MNRRSLLKQMIWMGGGIAFLPSCVYQQDKLSIQLKRIQVNPDQEKFLFNLANLLVPPTDTPGAADLGAHLFALKMVDDCYEQPRQEIFIRGLNALQKQASEKLKGSFNELPLQEQLDFIQSGLKDKSKPDITAFLSDFKGLVTRGYMQSEYVLTKLMDFKLVPGTYKACIPFGIKKQKT